MRFVLSEHGRAFATRPRGAELLVQVEAAAAGADAVYIDFSDVTSVSYSFADEFAGALMHRAAAGQYDFEPHLVNVPEPLQRVLASAIRNRGVERDQLFDAAEPILG